MLTVVNSPISAMKFPALTTRFSALSELVVNVGRTLTPSVISNIFTTWPMPNVGGISASG